LGKKWGIVKCTDNLLHISAIMRGIVREEADNGKKRAKKPKKKMKLET